MAPSGRLLARRSWIVRHLDAAVDRAGALLMARGAIRDPDIPEHLPCVFDGRPGLAKRDVLAALRLALHAAQDFYAEGNWTDRSRPGPITPTNPPGLGKSSPAAFIDPRQRARIPAGLIAATGACPKRCIARAASATPI